jgi:hypothetical protein
MTQDTSLALTLKEEVAFFIKENIICENGLWSVKTNWDHFYLANIDILNEKANAVINKLNSLSGDELDEFLDKDFETEIYDSL